MTQPAAVKKPGTKRPVRRLTATQKAEAIALWKSGAVTLDDLARKFKKDQSTFSRLFKEEGTQKGETEAETRKKVEEVVEKTIVSDAAILATRIKETKEEQFKMARGLAKLTWTLLHQARQEGRPIGTLVADMKALQSAASILKITREESYIVLGIKADDDNGDRPLPDLVVQELTAADIREMHKQKLQSDDELGGIEIVGMGDEELVPDSFGDEEPERVEVE